MMVQDNNEKTADDALVYAKAVFKEKFGEAATVTAMPQSRNFLFNMAAADGKQYVVKIYSDRRGLIANCEKIAYQKMRDHKAVRNCFALEDRAEKRPYAIFDYLEGSTVLESIGLLQGDADLERCVVRQIAAFIAASAETRLTGFGEIAADFSGSFPTWLNFLTDYLARLEKTIMALPVTKVTGQMRQHFAHLARFLAVESEFLASREAAFVPIDLNMANFLVTPDRRVVALDLENFWAADPLFALGEWAGHTFGTTRFDAFLDAYRPLTETDMASIRCYALISNLDVLSFIITYGIGDPSQVTPWGNTHRFVDLIAGHGNWLNARYG